MNLPNNSSIRAAYEHAVLTLANITDTEEDEASAFVDAIADLIFTTMQAYATEEDNHVTVDHH